MFPRGYDPKPHKLKTALAMKTRSIVDASNNAIYNRDARLQGRRDGRDCGRLPLSFTNGRLPMNILIYGHAFRNMGTLWAFVQQLSSRVIILGQIVTGVHS